MIQIKKASKIYQLAGKSIHALRNVNLHVKAGTIFGVIGPSGAGKSTLIRLVNLLEKPNRGQIFVDGVELNALSNRELIEHRQKIGMIFQHFNLLSSRTVAENVALALELAGKKKSTIAPRVKQLLDLVGLSDKANVYPANLSGGQKQRVAIARALACQPKVLLCDEATSALDPATTQSILNLLQEINAKLGLTILLITHEMEVVKRICHEVAIISSGQLIEQGGVGDIFASPKTDLARDFIQQIQHLAIPSDYQKRLTTDPAEGLPPLVRLEFTGESVDAPVISHIARQFNIDISILNSSMDYAGGMKFGLMLAEFFGQPEDILHAFSFLKQHNINVEVLGYVA
ncbi:MAG: methionine ABC transporter ATP-binding protein MetN [Enterovibrio sp.]